jgi:hypothetical protein
MRLVLVVMVQLGQHLRRMVAAAVAGALTEILQLLPDRFIQSLFLLVWLQLLEAL